MESFEDNNEENAGEAGHGHQLDGKVERDHDDGQKHASRHGGKPTARAIHHVDRGLPNHRVATHAAQQAAEKVAQALATARR